MYVLRGEGTKPHPIGNIHVDCMVNESTMKVLEVTNVLNHKMVFQVGQLSKSVSPSRYMLKDTLKAFNDFKNKQKSVWSNFFLTCISMYILKVCSMILHWDKTQMLKKFPSDEINGIKRDLFFWRAPTHHSFTFDLRFFYELNHKVRFSKTVCRIFHFRLRLVFLKVYIFVVQQNASTLWL